MHIFVKRNGVEEGPFTKEQLQTLLSEGSIRPTELAHHEGLSNWMPLAAVLAPRAQPPPYKAVVPPSIEGPTTSGTPTIPPVGAKNEKKPQLQGPESLQTGFMDERGDIGKTLSATFNGIRDVDWHTAFPWKRLLSDKPWDLLWVRRLLIFSVLPAVAAVLCDGYGGSEALSQFCVAGYIALLWAFGLSWIVKPQSSSLKATVQVVLPPVALQIGIIIIAAKIGWLSKVFAATADENILWRSIALMSIWTVWQSSIAVSLLVKCRMTPEGNRSILYLGSITGMITYASPVVARLLGNKWFGSDRWFSLGAFQSQPLASLLASMVVGTFVGAILGSVVIAATTNRRHQWHFLISGVVGSAALMTANALTVAGWSNVVLMVMLALVFVTYVRLAEDKAKTAQSI